MRGTTRALALALSAACLLIGAGRAAAATTLYSSASSTRTTQPCASDTPCKLDYAMLAAGSGDDVSLAPGKYYESGTNPWAGLPPVKGGVTVHGTDSANPPTIYGHVVVNAVPFLEVQNAGTLQDLELRSDVEPASTNFYGYTLQIDVGALVERVTARGLGNGAVTTLIACQMLGGTIRNSACLGSGPGHVDALTGSSSGATSYAARNVTAVTTATSGTGVRLVTGTQTVSMKATNMIILGTTRSVEVTAGNAGSSATLDIDHSTWYDTLTQGQGSPKLVLGAGIVQGLDEAARPPRFVNAAGGDYREAAGSPTIDAGVNDPHGTLALGGLARALGLSTDIGAYEHVPAPTAATGTATNVTDSAATLGGTVLPDGVAVATRFEYGTTAAYGRTASAGNVAATAPTAPATATITGLAPDTTYHYRLVATAGAVTSRGQDRTFRTLATPAGGQVNPAVVSAVTIGKRWRLGKKLPVISRKRKPRVGTNITFTLSKGARVTLSFNQRVKRRCRHGRRTCTVSIPRGKFSLAAYAGRNTVHFEGRISAGRRLRPGRHVLTITPDGSRASKSVSFTIVR